MAFAQSADIACMHKANEISRCFKNAHTETQRMSAQRKLMKNVPLIAYYE